MKTPSNPFSPLKYAGAHAGVYPDLSLNSETPYPPDQMSVPLSDQNMVVIPELNSFQTNPVSFQRVDKPKKGHPIITILIGSLLIYGSYRIIRKIR